MGEYLITIRCVVPGNVESFTPQEQFNECMTRIVRGQHWDRGNSFTTQWGRGSIKRIK